MQIIRKTIDREPGEWVKIFAMSDIHWGSELCDERQLISDLEEAREKNARVLIIGDIFDAIVFKDLKRYKPSVSASWLNQRDDILNEVVNTFYNKVKDYAELIELIGLGNHELSVIKYHGIDLISLLVDRLNVNLEHNKSKHRIKHGSYIGYLQYVLRHNGKFRKTFNILYYHGGGGSSPVTKGMIDISRIKVNWIFDVHIFGHKHQLFAVADQTNYLTGKGVFRSDPCRCIQTGTYQKSYLTNILPSQVSFGEEKAFSPKPIGCARFKWRCVGNKYDKLEIRAEI